jgi:formamidopyrimidine-DNA glycosylase
MPELPEVETVRTELESQLVGKRIEKLWWNRDSLVFRDFSQKNRLLPRLPKKTILKVTRKGKYLLLEMSGNHVLIIHLGMTGTLLVRPKDQKRDRHTHLELFFRSFKLTLRDPRMFGRVGLIREAGTCRLAGLTCLGPEPLSRDFNYAWLKEKFSGRKANIKSVLMDQAIAAGVGNIYSDEALFHARISPLRPAGSLRPAEIKKLAAAIKQVLKKAIKNMGTTFSDYRTSFGRRGDYRPLSYGREGEPCKRCRGKIVRVTVGNRSSFYCPACQK